MHSITILSDARQGLPITRKQYDFPEGWHEVQSHHLSAIAKGVSATSQPTIERALLLELLAGMPEHAMAAIDPQDVMLPVQVRINPGDPFDHRTRTEWQLLPCLDWCYTPPVFATSLLPSFVHDGTTWQGPTDRLENFTLGRFAMTDAILSAMVSQQSGEYALQLVGALYQPADAPWHADHIEACAKRLADANPELHAQAILNYRALRGNLAQMFPRTFSGDGPPLENGQYGIVYDAADSGVFGNLDQTEVQPLLRVLDYIEYHTEKNYRLELQAQKTTTDA